MAIGLFGSKKKPMFGNPAERYGAPQATPGIGDGMTQPMPMGRDAPVNQPGQKTGLGTRLFGQGWEDKAFALGGIMQGDPSGVYMMRQDERARQEAAQAARMAELKRAQDIADFETKEQIKARYAKPDTYRWRSNSGDLMEMGPDGQPRVAYDDPTDKIQWVRAENGDGTFTMVPVGANGPVGGGGGPLPEFTEDDWNGAGGGTGNGVGGF